jgi:hypothetical protein
LIREEKEKTAKAQHLHLLQVQVSAGENAKVFTGRRKDKNHEEHKGHKDST